MNLVKRLLLLALVLTVLSLLTSCQSELEEKAPDRSILIDDPCAAPCWQGITPGQTTIDEAFDILTELGYSPYLDETNRYIAWSTPDNHASDVFVRGVSVASSRRTGEDVTLLSLGLEFDLSLKEVLDKYGPPEKYQVYETMGNLGEGAHAPVLFALFYYTQLGLIFESRILISEPPGQTITTDSDTVLDWIYYFPPTSIERLTDDIPQLEQRISQRAPMTDWQGLPITYQRPIR